MIKAKSKYYQKPMKNRLYGGFFNHPSLCHLQERHALVTDR